MDEAADGGRTLEVEGKGKEEEKRDRRKRKTAASSEHGQIQPFSQEYVGSPCRGAPATSHSDSALLAFHRTKCP